MLAVAVATVVATATGPESASARWTRVAASRSSTEPYFVCPPDSERPQCELIEDPSRGSDDRGPVGTGAITAGPELQVSPALYGNGVEGGYSPENLRDAYDLPSQSGGFGQTIAIVDAYDDPDAESDLNDYRSEYEIPDCTASSGCFRKVNERGGSSSYPQPNGEWAREISLDLDMVSAICPNCHIILVEASNNEDSRLAAAENEAATLGATEISNSFASAAPSEAQEYAKAYDHPGISITAAGGDHGYGVVSPASNPHVIAVGGTTLVPASNRRGWTETVWYESIAGEVHGTGSGCSTEPKPAWQTDIGCPNRTTNDVAAVADPNTPVSVYDSYEQTTSPWRLLGGTSVATPIVAAAMALASPYTRSFEGAMALYVEAAINGTGALDDVVSGSNGSCGDYLCEAGPGYDGPTGLGSLSGVPEVPPPTAFTDQATTIKRTAATLEATVNPNGADVDECRFEYGTTLSYGSSEPCSTPPGSGTSPVRVSAMLSGLDPSTTYHFRIVIAYSGGSVSGVDRTFGTLGSAPTLVTEEPSAISQTSATLNAKVDPNGREISECAFEYGTTSAYESTVPCTPSPGSGQTSVPVSASLSGLAAGTTYHYRVRATNSTGASYGEDEELETQASAPPVTSPETSPVPAPVTPPPPTLVTPLTGLESADLKTPPPDPAAELAVTDLRVASSGAVALAIRCPVGETRCSGAITLRTLNAVSMDAGHHRGARRVLTLATGTFRGTGGRVATVTLRLSASARTLLARFHVLHVRATVVTHDASGSPHETQTATLRTAGHGA